MRDKEQRHDEVRKALTQLDLYHHSLKLVGHKLLSEAEGSRAGATGPLYEQSLRLSNDYYGAMRDLCDLLDSEDVDPCRSTLEQLDLAMRRASQAKSRTLHMVNIWRVIEAGDQFLAGIAHRYGYVRLSEETSLGTDEEDQKKAAELAELFEQYEEAMATRPVRAKPSGPPFSHGILHWRRSQLFYVEKVEDGARWIELDPDYERRSMTDDQVGVELAQARTIEGYPITLRLDLLVDENDVDSFIQSQEGSEYFVSGAQVAKEQQSRRPGRRRR